jgi:hypothetical protein
MVHFQGTEYRTHTVWHSFFLSFFFFGPFLERCYDLEMTPIVGMYWNWLFSTLRDVGSLDFLQSSGQVDHCVCVWPLRHVCHFRVANRLGISGRHLDACQRLIGRQEAVVAVRRFG